MSAAPARRGWRAMQRKGDPLRLESMPLDELLAGVTGSLRSGEALAAAIDYDPARLVELVPQLDAVPGVGPALAFRVAAALELAERARGEARA